MRTCLPWMALLVAANPFGCGARTDLLEEATDAGGAAGAGGDAGTGGFYSQTALALGSYHTCSVRFDGRVLCWGGNQQGQLGDGTTEARTSPVRVPLPAASVVALAAGFRHTCAALTTGEVYCWGENIDGQVSPAGDPIVTTPTRVPIEGVGLHGVNGLAAGEYHTCAALADGRIVCWGSHRQGQLGIGLGSFESGPATVPLPAAALQVTAGDFFTCALLLEDRSVWCFGQNHYGQLGDGTNVDSSVPVRARVERKVQRVDAGGFFALASLEGVGYPPLMGWGENGSGQLGPNVGEEVAVPTEVTPSWNSVHWSAGLSHSCAILWHEGPSETVCWGTNGHGQLGDGTEESRPESRPIKAGIDAFLVEAGLLHTCAESLTGETYCWGSNEQGQLGDGTTTDRSTPVRVKGI